MKWGERKEEIASTQAPTLQKGKIASSSDLFKSGAKNYKQAVTSAEAGTKIMCDDCCVTKLGDNNWLVEDEFGAGGVSHMPDNFVFERIAREGW